MTSKKKFKKTADQRTLPAVMFTVPSVLNGGTLQSMEGIYLPVIVKDMRLYDILNIE